MFRKSLYRLQENSEREVGISRAQFSFFVYMSRLGIIGILRYNIYFNIECQSVGGSFVVRKNSEHFSGKDQEEKEEFPVHEECPHHFGYLANRDETTPIPQECMFCLGLLKCIELNLA